MFGKKFLAVMVAILALGVFALTPAMAADNEVEIVYVEWDCATAQSNLIKQVLESQGYKVKLTPVSAAAMWQAMGSGDADAMVCAWLPVTHGHYLEKVKGSVDDLGPNLNGAKIGLVVPTYVEAETVGDLNKYADKFNHKIIGIDPGAGLMSKTEKAIKDYDLKGFKLVEGSGATMTAALGDAIKNKEWVVVTGWSPHWKFGRWDLKYLKDPKGVFGAEESINTIVVKGMKDKDPKLYAIMDKFYLTPAQLQGMMAQNQEDGAKPADTAKKFMKDNPDVVKKWVQ